MFRLAILASFLLFLPTLASAEFIGTVKLKPDDCQKAEYCELIENFGYIDKRGLGWQADKADRTDGASIPKWAQKFAGDPWTPEYLNASVLHDHYSKSVRPVRGWFETQRMFYEALVDSGVSQKRAALLYSGVLIGSGKWIVKMKGKKCPIGKACINNVGEMTIETEAESYGQPAYVESFERMKARIEASGELSEDDIVKLAIKERPNSEYLKHPDGVIKIDLDDWPWPTQDR